jgi:hypothetical protein
MTAADGNLGYAEQRTITPRNGGVSRHAAERIYVAQGVSQARAQETGSDRISSCGQRHLQ